MPSKKTKPCREKHSVMTQQHDQHLRQQQEKLETRERLREKLKKKRKENEEKNLTKKSN